MESVPTLWICATPIGHLGDISARLIEVLTSATLIAAEDTRVTKVLLNKIGINTPMISLQKYNEGERVQSLLDVLSKGGDVALVSDAGTPNIADPGAHVVALVREAGFKVSPVPGPSALAAFLSVSGVLANQFYFAGFLPKKPSELNALVAGSPKDAPFVFYETGNRLLASFAGLAQCRPIEKVVLGKELTKWYETIFAGSLDSVVSTLNETPIKGEWVGLVVWGDVPSQPISEVVASLKKLGLTPKQIVGVATQYLNYPKNAVYEEAHHD